MGVICRWRNEDLRNSWLVLTFLCCSVSNFVFLSRWFVSSDSCIICFICASAAGIRLLTLKLRTNSHFQHRPDSSAAEFKLTIRTCWLVAEVLVTPNGLVSALRPDPDVQWWGPRPLCSLCASGSTLQLRQVRWKVVVRLRATLSSLGLFRWFSSDEECGAPLVWTPTAQSFWVVGGSQASYGSHPWLVSFVHFFCCFLQETNKLWCFGLSLSDMYF